MHIFHNIFRHGAWERKSGVVSIPPFYSGFKLRLVPFVLVGYVISRLPWRTAWQFRNVIASVLREEAPAAYRRWRHGVKGEAAYKPVRGAVMIANDSVCYCHYCDFGHPDWWPARFGAPVGKLSPGDEYCPNCGREFVWVRDEP
jgi:hypothetical protein